METEENELSMEDLNVSGGYMDGRYLFRQETPEEQMAYIRKNAHESAPYVPYYDALIHWLTVNSKTENSALSMIDVTIAVKQAYGMSID